MKELTIKKGEFLEFIKESKSYTESWPAWKKECVQAVSRRSKPEQVSGDKSFKSHKKFESEEAEAKKEKEEEDGRLKSEGSERRVPSEGHAEGSDGIEV